MPPRTYDDVALATTLHPRERTALKADNHAEYHRLWHNAYSSTVWDRLTADAYCRSHRRIKSSRPQQEGSNAFASSSRVSGFVTNSSPAVYSLTSFKAGHSSSFGPSQETMAHPLLAKRIMHRDKLEYLAYIRPDTQTMAQTTRMMGCYETDAPHVAKAGVHMAHPGKAFHPDVHLTDKAWAVATHAHNTMTSRHGGRPVRPHSAYPALQSRGPAVQDAAALPDQGPAPSVKPAGHLQSRPVSARPAATPRQH